MARVNVRCWQETYRELMLDAVLNDPGFLAARERFWTAGVDRRAISQEPGGCRRAGWRVDRDRHVGTAPGRCGGLDEAAACALCVCSRPRHGCWASVVGGRHRRRRVGGAVGRRSQPSRARVLAQARLRCRRDGPGRGRRAGDSHGPRCAAHAVVQLGGGPNGDKAEGRHAVRDASSAPVGRRATPVDRWVFIRGLGRCEPLPDKEDRYWAVVDDLA